ncbi:MAG: isochorismatase family protein [Chlamydiota bacterium]
MKALLIIDMQNDFMPWGALPVFGADRLFAPIIALSKTFSHIYATQDWHPKDHISFASNHGKRPQEEIRAPYGTQILWPDHCVQETLGAELVKPIGDLPIKKIFRKGVKSSVDSYSAFFDASGKVATSLEKELQKEKVQELYVVGVAGDYCVKYSLIDAASLPFLESVFFVVDASEFTTKDPHVQERILRELQKKNVHPIFSSHIV